MRTMGIILSLLLVTLTSGCFLAPEQRAVLTQEPIRKAEATATTVATEAVATATQKASVASTQQAFATVAPTSGLVGNWVADGPGKLLLVPFAQVYFAPDATFFSRIFETSESTSNSEVVHTMVTGTYALAGDVVQFVVHTLIEDKNGAVSTRTISDSLGARITIQAEKFTLSMSGAYGADTVTYHRKSDCSVVSGTCGKTSIVEITPEVLVTPPLDPQNPLRQLVVGHWSVSVYGDADVPYWYLEFYPDGTFAGVRQPFAYTHANEVEYGSYETLDKDRIAINGMYEQKVYTLETGPTWIQLTYGKGKSAFRRCPEKPEPQTSCGRGLKPFP